MAAKRTTTIPLARRALVQRINRALKPKGQMLKTARGRAVASAGRYFVTDFRRGVVVGQRVDPEALARELGCLAAWEHVEDGD
jgi:hypothetical protein